MTRNDITIAITRTGLVLVAQGHPARRELEARDDIVDVEFGLYYSQMPHRAGWRTVEGVLAVGRPTDAPAGAVVYVIGRPANMCGSPVTVGGV